MKMLATLLVVMLALVATASVASAQMLSKTTPETTVTMMSTADQNARIKELVTANAVLSPWRTKQPPPFEFPDSDKQPRSLARDYKGQVVIAFLFAEW